MAGERKEAVRALADDAGELFQRMNAMEAALRQCQRVLAMLTSGKNASGPAILSAYAQCVEAEAKARRVLDGGP